MMVMLPKRVGIVVWLRSVRDARHLERYGHLIYVSRRLKYAVLYVNESEMTTKMNQLSRLPFVRKVEPSHLHEVSVEYEVKRPMEEPLDHTMQEKVP